MQKNNAAAYLAGVRPTEGAQASSPTNLHVISGVVGETSESGKVQIAIEGLNFSEADSQYIEVDTLGGLEEGDVATIILTGEDGHGMTPLAIGSLGSVDRLVVRITDIEADYIKAEYLEANYAHITEGVIDNATIDQADVNNLEANYAHISDGVIDNAKIDHADVKNLEANYAHISDGVIDNAKIGYANVDELETKYAQIDGANINNLTNRNAWIDQIMVQTGLIAQEGTVYTLDAVKVNAANITAGTIDVERLIVNVDGEKYLVHFDQAGGASYQKLDGGVIEDYTITADKIVAEAVTAEKLTTQNIVGTGGWINLRNGTFSYVNADTGEGIVWDGAHLYISGDVTIGDSIIDKISNDISDIVYDARYEVRYDENLGDIFDFTGYVYKAGEDISSTIPSDFWVWYLNTESQGGIELGRGRTCSVYASSAGYRATVIGGVEEELTDVTLIDSSYNTIVDSSGNTIVMNTTWSF